MDENITADDRSEAEAIEDGFARLEKLVRLMEGGSQSLEEAFESYRDGIMLVKELNTKITGIEKKLEVFNKQTGEFEQQDV